MQWKEALAHLVTMISMSKVGAASLVQGQLSQRLLFYRSLRLQKKRDHACRVSIADEEKWQWTAGR